jgi:cytochrome P450
METRLPPGPRAPRAVQTVGWWNRPLAYLERCRERYGTPFTMRLLVQAPMVAICDPDEIKQTFTAPPDVLHPGEGARILEPVVGTHSVILLDEGAHLEQRKLMLPAFHGQKMEALSGLVDEVVASETERWPRDRGEPLHGRLQALTLEVILRAVFGLDRGERLDALRAKLGEVLSFGASPLSLLPPLQLPVGPWARFATLREQVNELLYDLVHERRADDTPRDDVLAMLLEARHDDGSPMSDEELRDELMTMLVAGHETTASELAWAFERLAREDAVRERLVSELDRDGDDAYLSATVQETLRRRPVIPNAAPRLTKQEIEIGEYRYPVGVVLSPNAYLVHHDPAIYPDPYAFRPERFLDEGPGTYTWIPFGGGRRRCLGASFAILEMKAVLRAVLTRYEIAPGTGEVEVTRRRSITISPGDGARTVLRDRVRAQPVASAS